MRFSLALLVGVTVVAGAPDPYGSRRAAATPLVQALDEANLTEHLRYWQGVDVVVAFHSPRCARVASRGARPRARAPRALAARRATRVDLPSRLDARRRAPPPAPRPFRSCPQCRALLPHWEQIAQVHAQRRTKLQVAKFNCEASTQATQLCNYVGVTQCVCLPSRPSTTKPPRPALRESRARPRLAATRRSYTSATARSRPRPRGKTRRARRRADRARGRRGQRERDAAVSSHGFLVFFCLRSTAALGARVGQQVSRQSTDLLVSAVRHGLACRIVFLADECCSQELFPGSNRCRREAIWLLSYKMPPSSPAASAPASSQPTPQLALRCLRTPGLLFLIERLTLDSHIREAHPKAEPRRERRRFGLSDGRAAGLQLWTLLWGATLRPKPVKSLARESDSGRNLRPYAQSTHRLATRARQAS